LLLFLLLPVFLFVIPQGSAFALLLLLLLLLLGSPRL
jgi:hypothetical protein